MDAEHTIITHLEAADAEELAHLLTKPTTDEEKTLRTYLGGERYQRLRGLALRRTLTRNSYADQPKANVVIVPGMFGCELSSFDSHGRQERIWLNARHIMAGHLKRLRLDERGRNEADPAYTVRATGIMKRTYGELILSLADQWNVRVFWYDWRKDFKIAAAQLQARINTWFGEREAVHFVAHGEGGLVVRSYIAQYNESWQNRPGKLIMLGTPNYGLFTAIQAVTGQLEMIRWLDLLDTLHGADEVHRIIATFPSLYQLLPAPRPRSGLGDLYRPETYGDRLKVPKQHLENARSHHELLRGAVDPARMIYIAGANQSTVTDVDMSALRSDPHSPSQTLYTLGKQGDGRVPHKLGLLQSTTDQIVPTYYVEAVHDNLPAHPGVLSMLNELLALDASHQDWRTLGRNYGLSTAPPASAVEQTPALPKQKSTSPTEAALWAEVGGEHAAQKRDWETLVRRIPSRGDQTLEQTYLTQEECTLEETLLRNLSLSPQASRARAVASAFDPPKLKINLRQGDIAKIYTGGLIDRPVDAIAVGYYSGGIPEAAMKDLDEKLSAALVDGSPKTNQPALLASERLLYQFTQRGTIRGELAQTFLLNDPSPQGKKLDRIIAIAGMGAPGRFGAPELTVLVRELCWTVGRLGKQHLATVLIGTGRGNLSIEEAVTAWLRGLKFALTGIDSERQPILQEITFVEREANKVLAIDAALQQENRGYGQKNRMIITYTPLDAAERKKLTTQANQQLIDRVAPATDDASERLAKQPTPTRITVSLDGDTYRFGAITDSASIPVREIPIDPALVMSANAELATEGDVKQQVQLGQFMERLLIPADLRNDLSGAAPLVMMLDATTAHIHWELLAHTDSTAQKQVHAEPAVGLEADDFREHFWATSRGFTRQLRTIFAPPPEPPPPTHRILRVLVVADPARDDHLPGAEEEGIMVADLFEAANLIYAANGIPNSIEVVRLFGPSEATRTAVLRNLMMRTFDVLHFAGHCVYDKEDPPNSGWIFTGRERLTSYEFNRIDRVPKFVFSNACESGITPDRSDLRSVALAPSFAEAFFARGVANFVCTAW
ncbi:MAG: CHAT domain-containing protein, partial [Chloroflexota bacterium]|nr:CHAT domain-containing protein [Chloroflexota bacterium]